MAEVTKRIKISKVPIATDLEGFTAFGIRENADGTIDNVRTPMALLKGNSISYDSLTEAEKAEVKFKFSDLSASEKGELILKWEHLTPAQKDSLSFKYTDFTASQLAALKGDKGDKGDTGARGLTGEKGNPFVYSDFTQTQLDALKGAKGDIGLKGDKPAHSWSGTKLRFENPTGGYGAYTDLKGDTGEKGDAGQIENLALSHIQAALGFTPLDANRVKTDVPANAKFTDTNTTYSEITEAEINTGTASTLRTITARRVTFILSKVSTLISNAISALTKNDVGLGNLDNIQQATKEEFNTHDADGTRHITAGERSAWGAKWDYNESTIKDVKVNNAANADTVNGKTVAENVPAGAKFTDTVVSVSHLLPKSGGTIENYVEKLVVTTGAINLNDGNVFHRNATANTTFSITNAMAGAHSFTLIITMGATVRTLTFPASVKWQDGEAPDMTEANKTYILTFMTINSGTTWFGMEGGSF